MNKLYRFLIIFWGISVGRFIGVTISRYCDYKLHPDIYLVQSAPWYLSIVIQGAITLIISIILLITRLLLKKKSR